MKEENMDIRRETLLDALEDQQIAGHELDMLLEDQDSVRDMCLLNDCRTFFVKEKTASLFDVEGAWTDFSKKHGSRLKLRKWSFVMWGGVAACFLIALGLLTMTQPLERERNGIVVYSPDTDSKEVVLTTSNGQQTILSGPLVNSLWKEKSKVADKNDFLKYKAPQDESEMPEMHTLTTPAGGFYQVELSDGTQVWLNADSRLVYPSFFDGKERIVELHGEGFFKVAHDARRPFKVKANHVVTEVLGTEFNMRTYSRSDLHVTLITGSVKVKEEQSQAEVVIRPGEDAFLKSDGFFEVRDVDVDNYYLWTKGFFYFDKESLVEIMCELGRWYNVEVIFRNKSVMSYNLHFLAQRDKPLEDAVKLLNMMGTAKFSVKSNTIFID